MNVRHAYKALCRFPDFQEETDQPEESTATNPFEPVSENEVNGLNLLIKKGLIETIPVSSFSDKFGIRSGQEWQDLIAENKSLKLKQKNIENNISKKESGESSSAVGRFLKSIRLAPDTEEEIKSLQSQLDDVTEQTGNIIKTITAMTAYRMIDEDNLVSISSMGELLRSKIAMIDFPSHLEWKIWDSDFEDVFTILENIDEGRNVPIELLSLAAEELKQPVTKEMIKANNKLTNFIKGVINLEEHSSGWDTYLSKIEYRLRDGLSAALAQACLIQKECGGFSIEHFIEDIPEKEEEVPKHIVAEGKIILDQQKLSDTERETEFEKERKSSFRADFASQLTSKWITEEKRMIVNIKKPGK